MARLDIKDSTLKKLFALSGNRCVFPGCAQAVVNELGDQLELLTKTDRSKAVQTFPTLAI